MSFTQEFMQQCSIHPLIRRFIDRGMLMIDVDNMRISFNTGSTPIFRIKDLSMDDDSDMPMVVTYNDSITFTFMLDDTIGYNGKKVEKSIEQFAELLSCLFEPMANVKEISYTKLWRWSVLTIGASNRKFVSAPFSATASFVEIPDVIVQLLGKKRQLSLQPKS